MPVTHDIERHPLQPFLHLPHPASPYNFHFFFIFSHIYLHNSKKKRTFAAVLVFDVRERRTFS